MVDLLFAKNNNIFMTETLLNSYHKYIEKLNNEV